MPFLVTWTGPNGPERKKAATAADALRWWSTDEKPSSCRARSLALAEAYIDPWHDLRLHLQAGSSAS